MTTDELKANERSDRHRRKTNRFNRLLVGLAKVGIPLGRVHVLTTTGRRTGQKRNVPIGVVTIAGQRLVFQAYPKAAWVANVRAAPTATISHGRRRTQVRLVELPVEERRLLLRHQLENSPPRAGKLLVTTGLVDSPSPEDVASEAERIAVFRIESL